MRGQGGYSHFVDDRPDTPRDRTATSPAGFATRAIHDSEIPGGIAEEPVSPPIWLTSDYLYESLEHYGDVMNERRPGYA